MRALLLLQVAQLPLPSPGAGRRAQTLCRCVHSSSYAGLHPPRPLGQANDGCLHPQAYGVLAAVLVFGAIPNNPLLSTNPADLFYFVSLAVCTQ